jgi:hypothetical protein
MKKHNNKHILGSSVIIKTKTAQLLLHLFKHRIMKGQALSNQVHPIYSIHAYNPFGQELILFCVLCFMYKKFVEGLEGTPNCTGMSVIDDPMFDSGVYRTYVLLGSLNVSSI